MRIALFDSWNGKFSKEIQAHWESLGHEVKTNPQWEQAEFADKVFFYQADNVAGEGTHNHKFNGDVYVQAVDIECWSGQHNGVDWSKVKGCITMAKHIDEMVKTPDNVKRAIIKPGINLEKYPLRPPVDFKDPVRRIVYVVGDGRIWDVKRFDIALQLLRDLLDKTDLIWQLHVRGTYSTHAQYNSYCKYLEQDLHLGDFLFWSPRVEDMSAFLDDKDYFLLPSTKEAFSYATAEAMAKGIMPVIGNWQSAKETWGEYANQTYLQMLYRFLGSCYEPQAHTPEVYRKYVEDNYNQVEYFKKLDEFMGITKEVK